LIGFILLLVVISVDCLVRLVILWNMRKRKRAVKPLDALDGADAEIEHEIEPDFPDRPRVVVVFGEDNDGDGIGGYEFPTEEEPSGTNHTANEASV